MFSFHYCTARQCSLLSENLWRVNKQSSSIAFDETSSYQKAPNFSAFHRSPHGCWLVVWGITALSDSISVYIGPSTREREKEKRNERRE